VYFQAPTPTVDISVYNSITTPSGDVASRFDYIATAGDTAIFTIILLITFSLWAGFILYLFVRRQS
jgi:hypothetical protein